MYNSRINSTLISPEALRSRLPLSGRARDTVGNSIDRASKILTGESSGKILVVGPCSADFEDSLTEYAGFIQKMRERYSESGLEIIQRYYTGKPRTVGGWKGRAHSAPGEDADTNKGIEESRRIAIKLLEMGVPLADEMLHPQLIHHFDDIYSYLAVGARSTENQYHREVASGLDMPVGMKNPTSGDLETMLNGVQAGQTPSHYTIGNHVMDSSGNPLVHGVLRGGKSPNYGAESLRELQRLIAQRGKKIHNPGVIIDVSHDNCKGEDGKKYPLRQVEIIRELIQTILPQLELPDLVKGYMVESYLETGRQDYSNTAKHGLSLTDPCIGLDETERLIETIAKSL